MGLPGVAVVYTSIKSITFHIIFGVSGLNGSIKLCLACLLDGGRILFDGYSIVNRRAGASSYRQTRYGRKCGFYTCGYLGLSQPLEQETVNKGSRDGTS